MKNFLEERKNASISTKYNINLSILRIIAMGMVVAIHAGINVNWTQYVETGQYGVFLFFILSGYLIFSSLDTGVSTREFYKKRVLRIIPEYWTALVMCWIVDITKYLCAGGDILEALGQYNSPYGIRYLRYFTFTNMFFPSNNWYLWNNRHAWWTMSAFMLFYVLAPAIYKFFNSFKKVMIVLTILLCIMPLLQRALLYFLGDIYAEEESYIAGFCGDNAFCRLYCFFFGIVVYLAVREHKQLIYIVYLLAFLCVFNLRVYCWEIILTLCFMGVLQNPLDVGVRTKKIILFLSEGSFTLYCIHMTVMDIVMPLVGEISTHNSINFVLLYGLTCAVCYGYYWLYKYIKYTLVEKMKYKE